MIDIKMFNKLFTEVMTNADCGFSTTTNELDVQWQDDTHHYTLSLKDGFIKEKLLSDEKSMSDEQLQAITFYMGGSWVYDSLHDMPDSNKQRLLSEFIDCHGQELLDETIAYQANDYQDPMPKWLVKRCK